VHLGQVVAVGALRAKRRITEGALDDGRVAAGATAAGTQDRLVAGPAEGHQVAAAGG